jgi:plasmid stabilization system protein ParE
MAHQIIWTKRADRSLYKQVSYLAEHWSDRVVTEFVDKVYHITNLLADFPEMGEVLDVEKGIRCVYQSARPLIVPYR